jgi:purine-nucleoside phosphorylase
MRIRDHIDLQGSAALARSERGFGTPWDGELGAALDSAAAQAGLALESGVYAGLLGPAYETPAEIRWLRSLGADAVGMSTVAEANAGRACGLRVAGISCISNMAAGLAPGTLSHAEVLATGQRVAADFSALLEQSVQPLARALR